MRLFFSPAAATVGATLLAAGCASPATSVAPAAAAPAAGVRVLREIALPLPNPEDVRWLDPGALAVLDGAGGLFRLDAAAEDPRPEPLAFAAARASTGMPMARLGISGTHVAVGQVTFLARWQERSPGAQAHAISVEYLADLDLRGDRLLMIGVRRSPEGELSSDAAIAWRADLGSGAELEPVQRSAAGPGATTMQDCALVDLSHVRLLPGGGFVVVPGADPGVYLYDDQGRLIRAWDSSRLGLDTGCPPLREQASSLSGDPAARVRFLASRRVVDEVVALADGPALLVRSVAGDDVTWELHDGRWALGFPVAWDDDRDEPIPLALGDTGSLLVTTEGEAAAAPRIVSSNGWDLTVLHSWLGHWLRLAPGAALRLDGLPPGGYEVLDGDRRVHAAVTAGEETEIELGR